VCVCQYICLCRRGDCVDTFAVQERCVGGNRCVCQQYVCVRCVCQQMCVSTDVCVNNITDVCVNNMFVSQYTRLCRRGVCVYTSAVQERMCVSTQICVFLHRYVCCNICLCHHIC